MSTTKKTPVNDEMWECLFCEYKTLNKDQYASHLLTMPHDDVAVGKRKDIGDQLNSILMHTNTNKTSAPKNTVRSAPPVNTKESKPEVKPAPKPAPAPAAKPEVYRCEPCKYDTPIKGSYTKHLSSQKHIKKVGNKPLPAATTNLTSEPVNNQDTNITMCYECTDPPSQSRPSEEHPDPRGERIVITPELEEQINAEINQFASYLLSENEELQTLIREQYFIHSYYTSRIKGLVMDLLQKHIDERGFSFQKQTQSQSQA